MMRVLLGILVLFFISCSSKNPTIRTGIKKQTQEYISLAIEQYKKGVLKESKVFFMQALRNSLILDNQETTLFIYLNLAQISLELDETNETKNYIDLAELIIRNENITNYLYQLYLIKGNYFDKIGDNSLALNFYLDSLKYAENNDVKSIILQKIGCIYLKENKLEEANKYLEDAKNIIQNSLLFDKLATIYYYFGELYEKKNEYKLALSNYFIALNYDKTNENVIGIYEDLKKIGIIYDKLNEKNLSLYYLERALKVAENINDENRINNIKSIIK